MVGIGSTSRNPFENSTSRLPGNARYSSSLQPPCAGNKWAISQVGSAFRARPAGFKMLEDIGSFSLSQLYLFARPAGNGVLPALAGAVGQGHPGRTAWPFPILTRPLFRTTFDLTLASAIPCCLGF